MRLIILIRKYHKYQIKFQLVQRSLKLQLYQNSIIFQQPQ